MYVRINNPKLKNHNQIGLILGYASDYRSSILSVPVVIVQLIEHPYKLVIRIAEKNLTKIEKPIDK